MLEIFNSPLTNCLNGRMKNLQTLIYLSKVSLPKTKKKIIMILKIIVVKKILKTLLKILIVIISAT